MAMTVEQLRAQLSVIEPSEMMYDRIGPDEVPALEQLTRDPEPWMAARAVHALSRIKDRPALAILSGLTSDPRQEVRVALASITARLAPADAGPMLVKLLSDGDVGVRKFAVRAVSQAHDATVKAKLGSMAAGEAVPQLRQLATQKLRDVGGVP